MRRNAARRRASPARVARATLPLAALPLLMAMVAPQTGQPAPAFAVRDEAGELVTLADFEGRTVVLAWSTETCIEEPKAGSGDLARLRSDLGGSTVVWLEVVSSGPAAAVAQPASSKSPSATTSGAADASAGVRQLLDNAGTMARAYDVRQAPHFLVIDGEGRLRYRGGAYAKGPGGERVTALANAVAAVRDGQAPDPAVTPAPGCTFR